MYFLYNSYKSVFVKPFLQKRYILKISKAKKSRSGGASNKADAKKHPPHICYLCHYFSQTIQSYRRLFLENPSYGKRRPIACTGNDNTRFGCGRMDNLPIADI